MANNNEQRKLEYNEHVTETYLHEECSSYRDLSGITPEDLLQPLEDDIKYRALAFSAPVNMISHQESYHMKNDYHGASYTSNYTSSAAKNPNILDHHIPSLSLNDSQETHKNNSKLVYIPEKPSYLLPTSIVCEMRVDMIRDHVHAVLDNRAEVSYEFDASCFKWSGVFVCGTKHCKFHIQIYTNNPHDNYIVELGRVKGESCIFHKLYRDLKASLSPAHHTSSSSSDPTSNLTLSSSSSSYSLSDDEAKEALQPIIHMATMEDSNETRLEAAKILHQLSCRDETVEQMRGGGCVKVLAQLMSSSCDCTRRNAALALANLSESPSCQEAIVESGVLPILFNMIVNDSYQTCETRRACARLLANLSSRLSSMIMKMMSVEKVEAWMMTVDHIDDTKIQVHANRAKLSLQAAIMAL